LLDVLMPRMDGFEVAALIRERDASRHIPILFLTASSSESHLVYKGYAVGAVDYLVKPVSPDIVKAKVSVFVELHRKELRIRQQERALREAERIRTEERLCFLAAASQRLLGSLELESQLRDLAELVVESVGDWCLVEVATESQGPLEELAAAARLPSLSAGLEALREWRESSARARVREGHSELTQAEVEGPEPKLAAAGIRSVMRVPLEIRGQRLGQIIVATRNEDRPRYDATDLAMVGDLAHRIVLALENTPLQIAFHRFLGPNATHPLETLPTSQRQTILARSERQVHRLIDLVDKLLDVSRIAGGVLELDRQEVEVRDLLEDVGGRFAEELARAGCTLHIDATSPVLGHWDRLRVEQVLINLLSNAVKYGAGKPIELVLGVIHDEVRVEVRDHGIGIAPQEQQRIFGRFERAVSPHAYGGLGLGLYIARQIAEAHGGSIEVRSAPGAGSTFTLTLPTTSVAPANLGMENGHVAQIEA
jgi:signal transduction histidine kinase